MPKIPYPSELKPLQHHHDPARIDKSLPNSGLLLSVDLADDDNVSYTFFNVAKKEFSSLGRGAVNWMRSPEWGWFTEIR